MAQRIEHSDFPATMTIKTSGDAPVFGSFMARQLHFTALEDGIWIGTTEDMYYMKIDWKNVGHVIRWLQAQNRSHR